MKQRTMIASAIACEPSLLIADEPTTALDVTIQAQILDLITSLRDKLGTAVLLISHDLGIIAETCDEVAVMYLGRIVEKGTVSDFFAKPLHPYSRGLIDAIPLPREERAWLPTIPGTVQQRGNIKGCHFADRCPRTKEVCLQNRPEWVQDGSHSVLCFNPIGGN
jgi:oligopeptide/dipeptide ABC transporter ATP-binding protein